MADLKISQFVDGGAVQVTDEIATSRAGINTKVFVGSAAGLDAGSGVGDVITWQDDGSGNPIYPAGDGSQIIDVETSADLVSYIPPMGSSISANNVQDAIDEVIGTVAVPAVKSFQTYGGQLNKLLSALQNPLEQITGVCFIGDSITWGRTLPDQVFEPRGGTLADQRDVYSSPSFVNEFKRWVTSNFFDDDTADLSNWSGSSGGQSIATFERPYILFPKGGEFFDYSIVGPSPADLSISQGTTGSSITYKQMVYGNGNVARNTYHSIKFRFTGNSFDLRYGTHPTLASNSDYQIWINGVMLGQYETKDGAEANNNSRVHTFGYVRDAEIEIRDVRGDATTYLRLEAIRIVKKCVISNQGIIGATSLSYRNNALTTPPIAVTAEDDFCFVQLGTNDRINNTDTYPRGVSGFAERMDELLDIVQPLSRVILMAANPVENENPSLYSFTQAQARDTIDRLARERGIDFIDNYSPFNGMAFDKFTADGLHPNTLGHAIIARNIVNAVLTSADTSIYASSAQGALADTALQPSDGAAFATAAQGAKADSALQPYIQGADIAASTDTTYTIDYADGKQQEITFTSDCTLAFTFPSGEVCSLILDLIDAGTYTVALPAAMEFGSGVPPNFTASGKDKVEVYHDGNGVLFMKVLGLDIGTV